MSELSESSLMVSLGNTMTVAAGGGAPSTVLGNSIDNGEDRTEILQLAMGAFEDSELTFSVGKSWEQPATQVVFISSSSNCTSRVSLDSLLSSGSTCPVPWSCRMLCMPLPRTYIPPPTAPARQPICAISAIPPHLGMTEPNPGPKTPLDVRWRYMRGRAYDVDVWSGGLGERVNAWSAERRPRGI